MPFEEKILDVCVLKETSVHQVVKVLEASTPQKNVSCCFKNWIFKQVTRHNN